MDLCYLERWKKIKFAGGHIENMLFLEIVNLVFPGGHIEIMLFIEIENLVFLGGHIEVILFIEIKKNRISRRPY